MLLPCGLLIPCRHCRAREWRNREAAAAVPQTLCGAAILPSEKKRTLCSGCCRKESLQAECFFRAAAYPTQICGGMTAKYAFPATIRTFAGSSKILSPYTCQRTAPAIRRALFFGKCISFIIFFGKCPSFIKDALPPKRSPLRDCRMIGLCRRIRRLFRLPPLLLSLFSAPWARYLAIERSFPRKKGKKG